MRERGEVKVMKERGRDVGKVLRDRERGREESKAREEEKEKDEKERERREVGKLERKTERKGLKKGDD